MDWINRSGNNIYTTLVKVARFDFGPPYTHQNESVNQVIGRSSPALLQTGTLALVLIAVTSTDVRVENRWESYQISALGRRVKALAGLVANSSTRYCSASVRSNW